MPFRRLTHSWRGRSKGSVFFVKEEPKTRARRKAIRESQTHRSKQSILIKETKEDYYYRFPRGRWYIIRWLKDGGYHFYPVANGKLPEGYPSKEAAEKYLEKWGREDRKIVQNITLYVSAY